MVTKEEVSGLLADMESNYIERTISVREDKLGPAVCALSNDFPNHKRPGYILLGVNDNGQLAGCTWTDQDLQKIGNVKTNGNVLPQPSMTVSDVFHFSKGEVVVIEVIPSLFPPVRYDGRCWIRVGPRRDKASIDEEKILIERRASNVKTYDLLPALDTNLTDMNLDYFKITYLPLTIEEEVLSQNNRDIEEQLASLRFYDLTYNCPTNAGILVFGKKPVYFIPGAYIQYVKFKGDDMISDVDFEKRFSGAFITELKTIDDFIKNIIVKERPVRGDSFRETLISNYHYWSLREMVMNAIMHRSYESNAPIYIYEFINRIEIVNSGGLYGAVNIHNFPNASDYRNVVLAETMKVLGYVNRFNYGIKRAITQLEKNGNGTPIFDLTLISKFKVTININKNW
ncbi:MAG: putative DNA binding domain-containing protein [Marinilabiliaceae bacterium]|nr:putative DNA binding domain-containing protein [Marinilabiliaceae bacterium]